MQNPVKYIRKSKDEANFKIKIIISKNVQSQKSFAEILSYYVARYRMAIRDFFLHI